MRNMIAVALIGALISGCGGSDAVTADEGSSSAPTTAAAVDAPAAEVTTTAAPAESEPAPQSGGADNNVTLELENGTVIETSALCMLEPQEAAGSTILFTATGYSEIGFDVTQFDEDSFGGVATVSVYQTEDFQNFDLFWEADSSFGELVVELNGSTISGTGLFFEGDAQGDYDPFSQEGIPGTVTVDCG